MTRQLIWSLVAVYMGTAGCSGHSANGSVPATGGSGRSGTTTGTSPGGSAGAAGKPVGAAGTASGNAGTKGNTGTTGNAGTTGGGAGATGAAGKAGSAGTTGNAGATGGGAGATGSAGTTGTAGTTGATAPACDQVKGLVEAYKAAHPGNGGKDWDINAKTPAEIAADPAAQQLLALCGPDQLPVIPLIAWEYGGGDHPWINPEMSALVYCVYIPVKSPTDHWTHDAAMDHVTADVSIKCPDQNPCKDKQGADQVAACIGDPTNFEIFVDTASIHDGADVGLVLANSSTDLNLILSDGTKVHLYTGT